MPRFDVYGNPMTSECVDTSYLLDVQNDHPTSAGRSFGVGQK